MRPDELAGALRDIANRIDASKQPSRNLVASDLKRVVQKIASDHLEMEVKRGDEGKSLEVKMKIKGKSTDVKMMERKITEVLEECGDSKLSEKCADAVTKILRDHISMMTGAKQEAFEGLVDEDIKGCLMKAWGMGGI